MGRLIVFHACPDLRRERGGVAAAVSRLRQALEIQGVASPVITFAADPDERAHVLLAPPARSPWKLAAAIARRVAAMAAEDDAVVFHNHGLWSPLNHAVARVAADMGAPLVTSPHGMLLPWARRHRRWRKDLAWRLYQAADLARSARIHVTSPAEAEAVRAAGASAPTLVIPFGVDLAPPLPPRAAAPDGTRTLLFLGRIHPIKNLDGLIEAWGMVRPAGWRLVIAGPDEGGCEAALRAQAARLGLAGQVVFHGPAFDDAKARLLAEADALTLPSFSENFGVVAAEALACGLPVIASTGTPWSELAVHGCGWWAEPSPQGLSAALAALAATPAEALRAMGERGQALVRQNYDWEACAASFAAEYAALRQG